MAETYRNWTPKELNILKKHYGTMPNIELQKLYLKRRNIRAIELKAMRMGLSQNQSNISWSDDEINILKSATPDMTAKQIHEVLIPGRSVSAIQNKLHEIKTQTSRHAGRSNPRDAKNRAPWTDDEIEILKKYYTIMSVPAIQAAYLPNRSVHALENMARVILPPKSSKWQPNELIILKRYYKSKPVNELIQQYLPNKTQAQIYRMAKKLGLSQKQNKKGNETNT